MTQQQSSISKIAISLNATESFLVGGIAACGAVTVTNPAEVVKTRLQLQGELITRGSENRVYTGFLQALRVTFKNEGIRGIQRGLGAAYAYQIALNGCRLGFYETIRCLITELITGSKDHNIFAINVGSGAITGILGACLGSPFYLVKTRMQSYSTYIAVGAQYHYKNTIHALISIARQEGLRGLYRGMDAAIIRTGIGSSAQLPSYNLAKEWIKGKNLLQDGILLHMVSSTFSGTCVCLAMNPWDVVLSRMYNDGKSRKGGQLYTGPLDCMSKTIRTEGVLALYKGITPHFFRIMPHTVLTLVFMEQVQAMFIRLKSLSGNIA